MKVIAGLCLNSLNPRVWDASSPYYMPQLRAVMVSYASIHRQPSFRRRAMDDGLRGALQIPERVQIYLDNGAFSLLRGGEQMPWGDYEEFVTKARPDWYPIPQDYIPTPAQTAKDQHDCFRKTMRVNRSYAGENYVPVIHASPLLKNYVSAVRRYSKPVLPRRIALGGLVPNLLRTPKSVPHQVILETLVSVRRAFAQSELHIFGVGGTATLHLARLLEMDSVDSSGWRNRAARGIIQLPGRGDRSVADLGSWKGRELADGERELLEQCQCPACLQFGFEGLLADKSFGFCNRAAHNLWTLLTEAQWIEEQLAANTYRQKYPAHLQNSLYKPLVDRLAQNL